MPGTSKKGGGLESSPVYKKQGYGEGVSPFAMKSGNSPLFKQMGSSPLKQDYVKDRYHPKFNPTGTKGKPPAKPFASMGSKDLSKYRKVKTAVEQEGMKAAKTLVDDKRLKKKIRRKAIKKVAGKIASRLIPGVGWALAGHDVYKVGKKMKEGHSLKGALKGHYLGIDKK